jgi:hypothetical protein
MDGYTIVATNGSEIADGDTFTITDGVRSRTFEFEDLTLEPGTSHVGTTPGTVVIGYRPAETANRIAELIREAINAQHLAGNFGVSAALIDGTDSGPASTGPLVDLVGDAVFYGPSGVNAQISGGYAVLSDDVFRFENTSTTGEHIESITITLPAGLAFDTVLRAGTAGTNIHRSSSQVGAQFTTINPDEIVIDFARFGVGQKFIFGFDIFTQSFNNRYFGALGRELAGTTATIRFSGGREVTDTFFRLPVDGGAAAVLGGADSLTVVASKGKSSWRTRVAGLATIWLSWPATQLIPVRRFTTTRSTTSGWRRGR